MKKLELSERGVVNLALDFSGYRRVYRAVYDGDKHLYINQNLLDLSIIELLDTTTLAKELLEKFFNLDVYKNLVEQKTNNFENIQEFFKYKMLLEIITENEPF